METPKVQSIYKLKVQSIYKLSASISGVTHKDIVNTVHDVERYSSNLPWCVSDVIRDFIILSFHHLCQKTQIFLNSMAS